MSKSNRYYVYTIFSFGPRGRRPIYVGKGTGSRAMAHMSRPEFSHLGALSIDVLFHESEGDALAEEGRLIDLYGVAHQGGLLINNLLPSFQNDEVLDLVNLLHHYTKNGNVDQLRAFKGPHRRTVTSVGLRNHIMYRVVTFSRALRRLKEIIRSYPDRCASINRIIERAFGDDVRSLAEALDTFNHRLRMFRRESKDMETVHTRVASMPLSTRRLARHRRGYIPEFDCWHYAYQKEFALDVYSVIFVGGKHHWRLY